MELEDFKAAVDDWLDAHQSELACPYEGIGTLDEQMAQLRKVLRLTYDAGFMRMGWPERVGGLGGSNLLRAYLGEVLTRREFVEPGIYSMPEVLAPTMIDYAPEGLAAEMVPRLLRGEEIWCQGFSEPGTGSNLASLACRATRTDDRVADRRPESLDEPGPVRVTLRAPDPNRDPRVRAQGDHRTVHRHGHAGITVRPIETMHGAKEFCEVFFDDVLVPLDRVLGEVDHGWSIAMDLLPFERSTALWHRASYLQRRLEQLVAIARPGALDPVAVGQATELLWAFRARSRATQRRLAAGATLGAETSIDKVLVATAEQAVFDLVAEGLGHGGDARGRPGQPTLAGGIPLFPRRHHLRRERRDPAQHHRPPAPRPRSRPLMEAAERALFEAGVRHATESADGAALDAALDDLGWRDALEADRPTAVGVLFESQGKTTTTSAALDWLLASARWVSSQTAWQLCCRRCDRTAPQGVSTGTGASSKVWGLQHSTAARRRL